MVQLPNDSTPEQRQAVFKALIETTYSDGVDEILSGPELDEQDRLHGAFRDDNKTFEVWIFESRGKWRIEYKPLSGVTDFNEPNEEDLDPPDAITTQTATEAQPIIDDWLERVKSLLDDTTNLSEFQEKLESLYPDLNKSDLVDIMGAALTITRAGGWSDAGNE